MEVENQEGENKGKENDRELGKGIKERGWKEGHKEEIIEKRI